MAILASRHVKVSAQCPLCLHGAEDSTSRHLLFTCDRAKEVWKELGLFDIIQHALVTDRSGSVVLEFLLCNAQEKSPVLDHLGLKESIAVGCTYIWWQRREKVKGFDIAPPRSSAFAINALTSNYGSVTHASKEKVVMWDKPPSGLYKLNIDASYYQDGTGAVGIVNKDHRGEARAGMAWPINNVLNVVTAEAQALLQGLKFIEQIGCSRVIVESDSLEIIQTCNAEVEVWSPHAAILMACFQKATAMDSISFKHCPREVNEVAHHLAKYAYETKENAIWDGDPPGFILPFVTTDVTVLTDQ